jgi:hypothetical protein
VKRWLFEFGFGPEATVVRGRKFVHPETAITDAEILGVWESVSFPDTLIEDLNSRLHKPQMITTHQMRWAGGIDTYVDVFFEQDRLANVTAAIDVRAPHLAFVSDLCLVANRHCWLAIMPNGRFFRPCVRRFMAEIQHSPATRWIRGSLDSLAQAHLSLDAPGAASNPG